MKDLSQYLFIKDMWMTFRLTYFEKMQKVKKLVLIPHSVHWGINTPSKTPPHLFCQVPLLNL